MRCVRRHLDASGHRRRRPATLERLGDDRPRRHRAGRARLLRRAVSRHRREGRTDRHRAHGRRAIQLPAQRPPRPVAGPLGLVVGGKLPRDHPDRGGQHHHHRLGHQRGVLRQAERLHGVFRHEIQPALHLLRILGRRHGLRRCPQRERAVQRRLRRIPGRHDARGAHRHLLRRHRGRAGQPGGRGRRRLRRRARRRLAGMERRAVPHLGGRPECRRSDHLLHLPVPIPVAPQHVQRRRRALRRVRRRYPHRGRGPHPVRQLLRLGHLPVPGCVAGAAVSGPRERHGAIAGQRRPAEWFAAALGVRQRRDRRDDRGQRGAVHRQPEHVRGQGLRRPCRVALHGGRGDQGRGGAGRLRGAAGHRDLPAVRLCAVHPGIRP